MPDLPLYQVPGWNRHFENNKSRIVDKCAFVCSPNKHGGSGWSNVMGHPNGLEIWGVWKLLLDICSRQGRPRDGWLTADGKKEGRRLSVRELSNQLRAPIDKIDLALTVLSSPEVDFLRLISDRPADSDRTTNGTAVLEHRPTDDGQRPVDTSGSERRNEGKNEPPIVPREGTAEENEGYQSVTDPAPEGHSKDTDAIQYAEAERWLSDLYPGSKRHLDAEEMHLLSAILPLDRTTQRLITWGYTLDRDDEGWSLYEGNRLTKPKESRKSLLRDFNSEIDKWQSKRLQLGLNGHFDTESHVSAVNDWTNARRAAAFAEFGEKVNFATPWPQIPAEIQRQIDQRVSTAENKK